jgi:hypothetical protein
MAKRQGYTAVSTYLQKNMGLTDSILSLDTTDPGAGFTLAEAIAEIDRLKLSSNEAGYARAAGILAKTNWYKNHGVAVTQRMAQAKTAPGVFSQNIADTAIDIQAQANTLGFELSDDQAKAIAKDAYIYGKAYNSNKVIERIAGAGEVTGGQAMDTADALKAHSANMGVSYDDGWYTEAARNIAQNESTADDWKRQINDVAKSKYAAFADQIDKGLTVAQVASPYINSMSQILEVPPATISLTDPTVNKALTNLDADSKPALQPIWQFETGLRKDPRWASTKNARDALDSGAREILSSFGLVS